jgi:UDP-GlcNAc:undecaprenyl-phosphate GlcNAc-1-phosphate transferase
MVYGLIFAISLVTSVLLTPLARRLSLRLGMVAEPGGRRRHRGRIPTLGGIPVFFAFTLSALLAYFSLVPPESEREAMLLRGVLLGGLLMFLGGLVDDRWELPPGALFLLQLVAVGVAMAHQVFIQQFTLPLLGFRALDWQGNVFHLLLMFALTAVWILGMVNTINFLDGLDGLATGVGAIAAVLFAWHHYSLVGGSAIVAFPLALAGALLGFLPFNFAPARIFLGSAGAYFLGYSLATMSILAPAKIATALLVLAVPILDVAWQIVDRLRRGQSPFRGDRGHLHFRLSDFGLPTRRIVTGYYLVAIVFGLAALFAPTPISKLIILLLLSALVFVILVWLTRRASQQPPAE